MEAERRSHDELRSHPLLCELDIVVGDLPVLVVYGRSRPGQCSDVGRV